MQPRKYRTTARVPGRKPVEMRADAMSKSHARSLFLLAMGGKSNKLPGKIRACKAGDA
jgi:hypothetical protein